MTTKPISIYYLYKNVIDDETISKIMEIGKSNWEEALVNLSDSPEHSIRKTDIIWNNEQWLYDLFFPLMKNANQLTNWNLEVDCAEAFQLGKYEDGGHYDWHLDSTMMDPTLNVDPSHLLYGKTRKISMVCWLNDDFEGGEFEFHKSIIRDKSDALIKPTKGTVLFFPSIWAHKVHPVTKGTRYSLVNWFKGRPIR